MDDLLDSLGQKATATGEGKSSTSSLSTGKATLAAGEDLLAPKAQTTVEKQVESKDSTIAGDKSNVDSRDKDSLYDEIRELRAENKARRIQLQEETTKIQSKFEERLQQYETQMKEATTAKEELEALKAKEADKKRSTEERLHHREAVLAQLEADKKTIQAQLQAELDNKDRELTELRAQQEAQKQVYNERISEEIAKIPETRRKFAEMMIKGHSDPREAWAALSEAKADGLFEDKFTTVVHATPDAGASRMTQERLDAVKYAENSKLTPRQKIAEGLKQVTRRGQLL